MSRARLAQTSALVLMGSIVMFYAIPFISMSAYVFGLGRGRDGETPTAIVPIIFVYAPVLAAAAAGVAGLLGSGVWYLWGIGVERARDAREGGVADQVARMLTQGSSRSAIEQALLENSLAPETVQLAIALEWPRGPTCPECSTQLRGFALLRKHLGRTWHHCPNCGWTGEEDIGHGTR